MSLVAGLVDSALRRPGAWLASIAALTLLLGLGIARLEVRTDGAAIYPSGVPAIERTLADRRLFSEGEQVIVLMTARPGGASIGSREGLRRVREIDAALERVAGVDGLRLRSLASLLDTRPGVAYFSTPRFLDDIPAGDGELRALLDRMRKNRLAEGLYLAADAGAAAFYVPVAAGQEREAVLEAIGLRLPSLSSEAFDLRLAGPVAVEAALGRAVLEDLRWLTPIMAGVIALLFMLCLGSPAATLAAMCKIPVMLLCVFGAMGWAGVPVTLVTTVLPVILLTVSVTDEIHLLDRHRARLASGAATCAIAFRDAYREVGRAMVLTSLTTGFGFLSFLTASIPPLRWFGFWTACGVILALFLSFTFVPALILCLPPSWSRPRATARPEGAETHSRFDRRALRLGRWGVIAGGALLLLSVPGLMRLRIADSWIDNLDSQSGLVGAHRAFDQAFWGAYRLDVVLTSPAATYFQRAEGIRIVERVEALARATPGVGGVVSLIEAYETAGVLEGDGTKLSDLSPARVLERSALLMKIQRRIDLDHYLSRDGSAARVRLFVKDAHYARTRELERRLEASLPAVLAGTGLGFHFSGDLPAAEAVVASIVSNLLRSIAWTIAGVALLLAFALRGARAAAVAVAPLAASVPILLGCIGYAGLPLGIATSMFAAVMVGIGVDFSIHILSAYAAGRDSGLAHAAALAESARLTGRALRWNVAVLAAGLLVLTLSALAPNRNLGLLLAAAMPVCYLTTILFLPFLIRVVLPSRVVAGATAAAIPVAPHAAGPS